MKNVATALLAIVFVVGGCVGFLYAIGWVFVAALTLLGGVLS